MLSSRITRITKYLNYQHRISHWITIIMKIKELIYFKPYLFLISTGNIFNNQYLYKYILFFYRVYSGIVTPLVYSYYMI